MEGMVENARCTHYVMVSDKPGAYETELSMDIYVEIKCISIIT